MCGKCIDCGLYCRDGVHGGLWVVVAEEDPDVVRLADVYRELVFDPRRGRRAAHDPVLDAALEQAAAGAAGALDAPLRALAAEPPTS